MRAVIRSIFVIICCSIWAGAWAGDTQNFTFAGLELGVSSFAQAKAVLASKARIHEGELDRIAGGKTVQATGKLLKGAPALAVLFIFDADDRLAGISITGPAKYIQTYFNESTKGSVELQGRASAIQRGNGVAEFIKPQNDQTTASIQLATLALDSVRHPVDSQSASVNLNRIEGIVVGLILVAGLGIFVLVSRISKTEKAEGHSADRPSTGLQQATAAQTSKSKEVLAPPESFARSPTQLERALASIHTGKDREERLIMLGDPAVEKVFFITLQSRGMATGRTITTSPRKAAKIYLELAPDFSRIAGREVKTLHALDLYFGRQFGSDHHIAVMVSGIDSVIDTKLREIGTFLQYMLRLQMFNNGNRIIIEDGKVVLPANGPLTLHSSQPLVKLISAATVVVVNWTTKCQETGDGTLHSDEYEADRTSGEWGNTGYDNPYGAVNPANGMPMIPGSNMDVQGNVYGTADSYGGVNPANGLPMVSNSGVDIHGNAFGTNNF